MPMARPVQGITSMPSKSGASSPGVTPVTIRATLASLLPEGGALS